MTQQFILTEELNPLENVLKAVIYLVNRFYVLIKGAFGLLGLVLLMPIFAVFTFVLFVALRFSNRHLNRLINDLFKVIDKTDARGLMKIHFSINNRKVQADKLVRKTRPSSGFFLIMPLVRELNYSRNMFSDAERKLHRLAYPHLYVPLTEEQKAQLRELSKNFEGVWDDGDCQVATHR